MSWKPADTSTSRSHAELTDARERAERECRSALSPRLRTRFDAVLELAQHYARVREEQVTQLTLGWPLARRALNRLGESCVRRGVIDRPEDIYFLERSEVSNDEPRVEKVTKRRETWERTAGSRRHSSSERFRR